MVSKTLGYSCYLPLPLFTTHQSKSPGPCWLKPQRLSQLDPLTPIFFFPPSTPSYSFRPEGGSPGQVLVPHLIMGSTWVVVLSRWGLPPSPGGIGSVLLRLRLGRGRATNLPGLAEARKPPKQSHPWCPSSHHHLSSAPSLGAHAISCNIQETHSNYCS